MSSSATLLRPPPADPKPPTPPPTTPAEKTYTDVFVAVHGIGDQYRNATIQVVASQLVRAADLQPCWPTPPTPQQPLGYFQRESHTVIAPVAGDGSPGASGLALGLAEVYWADIPRRVVAEGRTLEETKAWAASVVARAEILHREAEAAGLDGANDASIRAKLDRWRSLLARPDFALGAEVLDQMIETIYVLESVLGLLRRTGISTVDITGLLNDFLGDVQLVTEFTGYRLDVIGRFHSLLQRIYEEQVRRGKLDVRIHIIAHSEGTVVAFLGLLHALSGQQVIPDTADGPAVMKQAGVPAWLGSVHSLMTIGSPINKHLMLWPDLWTTFGQELKMPTGRSPIRWRNYYDIGDPVGFRLDTAQLWLEERKITAFEFTPAHDIGFARYLVAGKAHVDYWNDSELFDHYLRTAVFPARPGAANDGQPPTPATFGLPSTSAPASRWWVTLCAPVLPYLLCLTLLMIAVAIAGQAIGNYVLPPLSEGDDYLIRTELGFAPPDWGVGKWKNIVGLSLLLAGVTLLARLPRLAAGVKWKLAGIGAFALGALGCAHLVDPAVMLEIGYLFSMRTVLVVAPLLFWIAVGALGPGWRWLGIAGALLTAAAGYHWHAALWPMVDGNEDYLSVGGTFLIALTVATAGLAVTRRSADRQKRWLFRGMRPLIVAGAIVVVAMVGKELAPVPLSEVREDNMVEFTEIGRATDRTVKITSYRQPGTADERRMLWWDLQALAPFLEEPAKHMTGDQGPEHRIWRTIAVIESHPPLWTVGVGTAIGLYLWWLAALLFDLSFVWHRYIRRAGLNLNLGRWSKRRKARKARRAV